MEWEGLLARYACAVSFALMERTMGVGFDPVWLRTPVRTVGLRAPGVLFPDADAAWEM
ncbi:hypothetical protein [Streptomyces sp. NPDC020917]|uniref:hypothetical protein n=1 Tax=Streptomyces sp. NPDC020917 TaxID=3365102 RepID=UPI0037A94EBF